MKAVDRPTSNPVIYEVAPFRHVWIVRRRGSHQETLYLTREEAVDRAKTLCRSESRAELIIHDFEPQRGRTA